MLRNQSKLLTVILMLATLITALAALTVTAAAADTEIVFNLGADGSAAHVDGSSKTTYSETSGAYTLDITGGTNMYTGARDAQGNGCIKLGTSSKTGSFSFTVPDDVTSVVIAVGKYKSDATKVSVNGTAYTISTSSNDGAYTNIEVDTSTTKTVTFTGTSKRTMVNSITYVISGNSSETDCEHTNTTETTVEATCTTAGSVAVTCDDCEETISTTPIAALGHSGGTATCEELAVCDTCGEEYGELADHSYVNGTCSICGAEKPTGYTLVTDISMLKAGDKIVIVATEYNYALSTTQNNNNRGSAEVVKNGNIVTFGDDVQVLTLEAGTVDGTFAFYTGSGYLYAASSGSNYLKTQATNNANGSWKITITDGVASIVAQGTYTHNTLKYNSANNTGNLFSCYASGQSDVSIYYLPSCTHTDTTTNRTEPTCTEPGSINVVCNTCSASVSTETIDALGHSYDAGVVTEPTCTEGGYTTHTCSVCSYSYTDNATEKIDHSYESVVTEPTCSSSGYTTYTCSECGDSYKDDETGTGGHTYEDFVCIHCGTPAPDYSGEYFIATNRAEGNYFYITSSINSSKRYVAHDSGLAVLPQSVYALDGFVFVLERNNDLTYYIYAKGVEGNNYLAYSDSNDCILVDKASAKTFTVEMIDGCFNIHYTVDESKRYLSLNSSVQYDYFGWYTNGKENLSLISVSDEACQHTSTSEITEAATCEVEGLTRVVCDDCGFMLSKTALPIIEHNYVNGLCTVCKKARYDYSGKYYIAAIRSSGNYWYMTSTLTDANTKRYTAANSGLTSLPSVIFEEDKVANQVFVLVRNDDGTYLIYAEAVSGDEKYLGWTNDNENSGILVTQEEACKFIVEYDSETKTFNIYFTVGTEDRYLSLNTTANNDYFAMYKGTQVNDLTLIPVGDYRAVIDFTLFDTVENALAAAKPGETVSLLVDVSNDLTITEDMNLAIDLNGKNINGTITNNGKLSIVGRGTITAIYNNENAVLYSGDEQLYYFRGSSVRYADVNGVIASADKLAFRFGYYLADAVDKWGWTYKFEGIDGTYTADGVNITKKGISSVVFKNMPPSWVGKEITVQLWFTVNVNGVSYKVYDTWQVRTPIDVLEKIVENEVGVVANYAAAVIELHEEYLASQVNPAILNDDE